MQTNWALRVIKAKKQKQRLVILLMILSFYIGYNCSLFLENYTIDIKIKRKAVTVIDSTQE